MQLFRPHLTYRSFLMYCPKKNPCNRPFPTRMKHTAAAPSRGSALRQAFPNPRESPQTAPPLPAAACGSFSSPCFFRYSFSFLLSRRKMRQTQPSPERHACGASGRSKFSPILILYGKLLVLSTKSQKTRPFVHEKFTKSSVYCASKTGKMEKIVV